MEVKYKQILCDYLCLDDVDSEERWFDHAYEYRVGDCFYVVCDEEGEEEILKSYREASICAAYEDIPEMYHDFFDFNEFADYTWQTIYDIYDTIQEVVVDNNKYYICLM